MEIKLGDRIKSFRKERSLTQEQLAEAVGVTVGAVYKWETGRSFPELNTLLEIADLFDTSVDVLLGYEMRNHGPDLRIQQLRIYREYKDPAGLHAAEMALKKYPNCFGIVHEGAKLYRLFGIAGKNSSMLSRGLELFRQALLLLPQNTDPKINEISLYGEMAEIYLAMGKPEEAVSLLAAHNAGGLYSDRIGQTLSRLHGKTEDSLFYLSEALLHNVFSLIRIVIGYHNIYSTQKDDASAHALLHWAITFLLGLRNQRPCFLDKTTGALLVSLAFLHLKSGSTEAARGALKQAKALARDFDTAPDYSSDAIRFVTSTGTTWDDLSATAHEAQRHVLAQIGSSELQQLWEEV